MRNLRYLDLFIYLFSKTFFTLVLHFLLLLLTSATYLMKGLMFSTTSNLMFLPYVSNFLICDFLRVSIAHQQSIPRGQKYNSSPLISLNKWGWRCEFEFVNKYPSSTARKKNSEIQATRFHRWSWKRQSHSFP